MSQWLNCNSDIDFSNDLLHVRKGKNYRERYVPISQGVKKELLQWVNDGQTWFAGEKTNILIPNSKGKATNIPSYGWAINCRFVSTIKEKNK